MRSQMVNDQMLQTYVVIFDVDDPTEVIAGLTNFARQHAITAAQVTAIGQFTHATLGFYDNQRKEYLPIEIAENVEVLSLLGDIAHDVQQDAPKVHLHAIVGLRDGSTRGGHLLSAQVGVTLEVVVNVLPARLERVANEEVGLALIRLPGKEL